MRKQKVPGWKELTVNSSNVGQVYDFHNYYYVDTSSGNITISSLVGGHDCQEIVVRSLGSNNLIFTHGADAIEVDAGVSRTMTTAAERITLQLQDDSWYEVAFSANHA